MFGNYNVTYEFLGFGGQVAEATIDKMKGLIRAYSKNPIVISFARSIVSDCEQKDDACELDTIYNFVQSNSRYVKDPAGTEMIQSPLIFINDVKNGKTWNGDCDDYSVLLLSLYRSIGYPTALRAASYYPNKILGHVYGMVLSRGKWIAVDGIKEGGYVGWEAPNATRVQTWQI